MNDERDHRPSPRELAEAESSLLVHLELYDLLGSREGVAAAYDDLGTLYRMLGDLEPAEAMVREALALHAALGRTAGVAAACGHLGRIRRMRGDSGEAAAMLAQSIALYRELRDDARANELQQSLDDLSGLRPRTSASRAAD